MTDVRVKASAELSQAAQHKIQEWDLECHRLYLQEMD